MVFPLISVFCWKVQFILVNQFILNCYFSQVYGTLESLIYSSESVHPKWFFLTCYKYEYLLLSFVQQSKLLFFFIIKCHKVHIASQSQIYSSKSVRPKRISLIFVALKSEIHSSEGVCPKWFSLSHYVALECPLTR